MQTESCKKVLIKQLKFVHEQWFLFYLGQINVSWSLSVLFTFLQLQSGQDEWPGHRESNGGQDDCRIQPVSGPEAHHL